MRKKQVITFSDFEKFWHDTFFYNHENHSTVYTKINML